MDGRTAGGRAARGMGIPRRKVSAERKKRGRSNERENRGGQTVLHVIRSLTQLTNLMRLARAVLDVVIDQAQLPEKKHSRQQQRQQPQGLTTHQGS